MPGLRASVALLTALTVFARYEPQAEIIVNVTMTEEGRKRAPATPEHPVTYVPIIAGWDEQGKIVAGEEPPPKKELLTIMHRELAKQGYIFVPDPKVKPELLLVFEWGYLNRLSVDSTATTAEDLVDNPSYSLNDRELARLVLGEHPGLIRPADSERLYTAMQEDRYFVIVTAYDFDAARKNQKKPLWRTRMSTPREGIWLKDVMGALIVAGAPHFGRETAMPVITMRSQLRQGNVTIGTPVEVPGPNNAPGHGTNAVNPPPPAK